MYVHLDNVFLGNNRALDAVGADLLVHGHRARGDRGQLGRREGNVEVPVDSSQQQ